MTAERQSIESRNAPSPAASLGGPTPRAVPGACRRGLGNEAGGGGPPPERPTAVEPADQPAGRPVAGGDPARPRDADRAGADRLVPLRPPHPRRQTGGQREHTEDATFEIQSL